VKRKIIHINERLPLAQTIPLSLQHLFAMFGGTVLVPYLFKINPATSIMMNGVGTLLYIFITKGKIPAYLGSSFAFISPVFAVLAIPSLGGYAAAQSGFIIFGIAFVLISLIVRAVGTSWLDIIFPPAAMGAIVMVIGLELAPVAAEMAGFPLKGATVAAGQPHLQITSITVSTFTLGMTILTAILGRKFIAIIPVLVGVVAGYLLACYMHIVDFSAVSNAPWFQAPTFYKPSWNWNAIIIIMPALLVVLAEHIGHLAVTGHIVEQNLIKKPGLHRSLFGDGISNIISGLVGATPNTTYGENIGVMAITRVFSVWVIGTAAVIAIIISFIGKLAAFIRSIPTPVMGGVCILLFGMIAAAGIKMLVQKQVDYSKPRNLILTSAVLIIGLSGTTIKFGNIEFKGMALATIVAVVISLVFALIDYLKINNDAEI